MEAFPRGAALENLHTAVFGPLLGVPIFPAFVGGPGMGGGRGTSRPRIGSFVPTSRGRDALPEGDEADTGDLEGRAMPQHALRRDVGASDVTCALGNASTGPLVPLG